jgi:hypothetical protein
MSRRIIDMGLCSCNEVRDVGYGGDSIHLVEVWLVLSYA